MSGSNNYTEEEVAARTEELQSGTVVVDRNTVQQATDIVSSIQDLIFRSINADVDSVYYFLKLLVNRHVLIASKILSNIDLLDRYAPVARQEDPQPDTTKLTRLIEISEELEFAGPGQREVLLAEFTRVTEALASSSVTPGGHLNAGISPSYAKEQSLALAAETAFLIEVLEKEIPYFLNGISNYSSANFETVSFDTQAKKAKAILSGHEGNPDLSGAILDSVVLASLLTQKKETKRDITIPKYEGVVTTLPGTSAELLGGTDPFILQETAAVEVEVNGVTGTTADISGDKSNSPSIEVFLNQGMFVRTEAGVLHEGVSGFQPVVGYQDFSSTGRIDGNALDQNNAAVETLPYLKAPTRPSTGWAPGGAGYQNRINVHTSVHNNGLDIPISCFDDGVTGDLINFSKVPHSPHVITPQPFPDGIETTFVFQGTGGVDQPFPHVSEDTQIGIAFIAYSPDAVVYTHTFTPTGTPGAIHGDDGFYQCTVSPGPQSDWSCELNFLTGEVRLHFLSGTAPPSTAVFMVDSYYTNPIFGNVDYESGHIWLKLPFPLTEGAPIVCDYGYYPIGRFCNLDVNVDPITVWSEEPSGSGNWVVNIPIQSQFSRFGLHKDNEFIFDVLPIPSSRDEWVVGPSQLNDMLRDSDVNGSDISIENTLDHGGYYKYRFNSLTSGSMSRLCFPQYETAKINPSPFGPTWLPGSEPSTVNQAISALYAVQGERFGKDTLFSELVTDLSSTEPGEGVDVDCPYKSTVSGEDVINIMFGVAPSIDGTKFEPTVLPDNFEIGDDIKVRWSPGLSTLSRPSRVFHTKIISLAPLHGDPADLEKVTGTVLEVNRPLSLPVDESSSETLVSPLSSSGGDWEFDASRSKIRIKSQSQEANSALSVLSITGSGLGFSDSQTASGFSTNILLAKVDLHGDYPRAGYEIHPNDVILEKFSPGSGVTLRPIGRVVSVSGDSLSFEVLGEPTEYPYSEIKIVALGWFRYTVMREKLSGALGTLSKAITDNSIVKSANVFVQSGSGQGQYMTSLFEFRTAIDLVRNAYLGYDSHVVKSAEQLLNTLKQERLTLPLSMLMTAQFNKVAEITVAEVSEQMSIDNLLSQAFDLLGGNSAFFDVSYTQDVLNDYYERGEDGNYPNEPNIDTSGDLL